MVWGLLIGGAVLVVLVGGGLLRWSDSNGQYVGYQPSTYEPVTRACPPPPPPDCSTVQDEVDSLEGRVSDLKETLDKVCSEVSSATIWIDASDDAYLYVSSAETSCSLR
jgi:hypothetical protein